MVCNVADGDEFLVHQIFSFTNIFQDILSNRLKLPITFLFPARATCFKFRLVDGCSLFAVARVASYPPNAIITGLALENLK
jgi:hypothetical protein